MYMSVLVHKLKNYLYLFFLVVIIIVENNFCYAHKTCDDLTYKLMGTLCCAGQKEGEQQDHDVFMKIKIAAYHDDVLVISPEQLNALLSKKDKKSFGTSFKTSLLIGVLGGIIYFLWWLHKKTLLFGTTVPCNQQAALQGCVFSTAENDAVENERVLTDQNSVELLSDIWDTGACSAFAQELSAALQQQCVYASAIGLAQ